jgi:GTP cyclohydrolase FolE2
MNVFDISKNLDDRTIKITKIGMTNIKIPTKKINDGHLN